MIAKSAIHRRWKSVAGPQRLQRKRIIGMDGMILAAICIGHFLYVASLFGLSEFETLVCTLGAWFAILAPGICLRRLSSGPGGLYSMPSLWVAATALFSAPSALLWLMEGKRVFATRWHFGHSVAGLGAAFCLVGIALLSFTLMADLRPAGRPGQQQPKAQVQLDKPLRIVVWTLFILSMLGLVLAMVTGESGTLMATSGYSAFGEAKTLGRTGVIHNAITGQLLPWTTLLLFGVSHPARSMRPTLVAAILAVTAMLLTGDRTGPVIVIALSVMLTVLGGRRISRRKMQIWIVATFFGILILIPVIRIVRLSPWKTLSFAEMGEIAQSLESALAFNPLANPLLGIVDETNGTMQATYAVVTMMPEESPYRYGVDLVVPVMVAVPFHSRFMSAMGLKYWERTDSAYISLTQWLNHRARISESWGLGFSQVAEFYSQFGIYGFSILFAVLGWAVGAMWRRMLRIGVSNRRALCLFAIIWYTLLVTVRNTMLPIPRAVLWGFIICYLLPVVCAPVINALTRQEVRPTIET